MDFAAHFIAQAGIDQTMARQGQSTLKGLMHNHGLEVHAVVAVHFNKSAGHSGLNHLGNLLWGHLHTLAS